MFDQCIYIERASSKGRVLTLILGLFLQISQLRHELSMRDDLLHFYASTEDIEQASETL